MILIFRNLILVTIGSFLSNLVLAHQPLPSDLAAYFQSLDVSYSIIEKNKLGPQVLRNENADVCIKADFDGNGMTDYALAVYDEKDKVTVVVFLKKKSGYIHEVLPIENYYDYPDPNQIKLEMFPATGEIETLEDTLNLEYTGIGISWFDSPTSGVYYWKDSEFVKAWTAD